MNFSITEFMDSWIYQPGFPLIQLNQIKENKYIIRQEVFTIHSKPLKKLVWKVPLFLKNSMDSRRIIWLTEENKTGKKIIKDF